MTGTRNWQIPVSLFTTMFLILWGLDCGRIPFWSPFPCGHFPGAHDAMGFPLPPLGFYKSFGWLVWLFSFPEIYISLDPVFWNSAIETGSLFHSYHQLSLSFLSLLLGLYRATSNSFCKFLLNCFFHYPFIQQTFAEHLVLILILCNAFGPPICSFKKCLLC